jgi:hypothetical protein
MERNPMNLVLLKNTVAAILALIAAVSFLPSPAQAQVKLYYMCPYGPGAGEVEHHREPQYDNQGRVYNYLIFCVEADRPPEQQQQEQDRYVPPPPTPKVYTDAYFSVAVHPDAVKVWASALRLTAQDAEKSAMAYCTKTMGNGCKIATTGANGGVTIFKFADGTLRSSTPDWGWNYDAVIKQCQAKGNPCAVADVINSPQIVTEVGAPIASDGYYVIPENNADLYNRFGAIAWVGNKAGSGKKIWTSGGHKSRAEAESAAISLCQKAQPGASQACKTAIAVGNGIMIVRMDKQKNILFESGFALKNDDTTLKLTTDHFSQMCKAQKPKCSVKYVIDARNPGDMVRELK